MNDIEAFQHADGSGRLLVVGDDDTQRSFFFIERLAVAFVGEQDVGVLEGGVEFSEGEDDGVAVFAGGQDVAG